VESVKNGLHGARLAHLACHGTFRIDNPSFSSLEFSDGPLTVLEIESLRRTPDTVVIASCDSGASQALPGDELRGFLTALFMMGTRSVVASAVPVPDGEVGPLMLGLHKGLSEGLGTGEALARARSRVDISSPEGLVLTTAFAHFGAG
jgi:CHAT domain-containing protein